MLNFHGYGGSASDRMQAADMRSLADNENFILVYPQGTCFDGASLSQFKRPETECRRFRFY